MLANPEIILGWSGLSPVWTLYSGWLSRLRIPAQRTLLSWGINIFYSTLTNQWTFVTSAVKTENHPPHTAPPTTRGKGSGETYWIDFFFWRAGITACWVLWYSKFRLLGFWLSFAFFGNWFCHRFRRTPLVSRRPVYQRWGRLAGSTVILPIFWRMLGRVQFHIVAVILRVQLPVAGVGDIMAARVLGCSEFLWRSLWHQGLIDNGRHLLLSHAPFILTESCPWARVLFLHGFWGGRLGGVALFGACFRGPGGCGPLAIKMRGFLWGWRLFWYLLFWIFFNIYPLLKSLFDIIRAWKWEEKGKEGDKEISCQGLQSGWLSFC